MFIGAIYIAFRLIGAGMDYLSSSGDNTNTTPIEQESFQVDQDNSQINQDSSQSTYQACNVSDEDINNIRTTFVKRFQDLKVEIKVFDVLCENDQFVFEVLSIRDQNSIEYYNSALFTVCCHPLVYDKNTQLIYGSLTMFDPPHINIDKPLQLDFYGGSSNIDLSILSDSLFVKYKFKIIGTNISKDTVTTTTVPPTTTTTTTTTSTTTTTLPLPPNIESLSCPNSIKVGEEIIYRYTVSAPTSEVTSVKYQIDLNGNFVVDDSIENNSLALPGLAKNSSYEYIYTIPSVSESTDVTFTVTAINQRGNESSVKCISSIEIDKIAPDMGTLEVYAGYSYSSSVGGWAPHQSTGYLNGRTFRVRSSLINDDTLEYISFTLTPHESIGTIFLNCRLDYDSQTVYVSGTEILCVTDYPTGEVNRFVPWNKTSREWQGWYRLDVELVDGSGNSKTIQYCKVLRIVGGYQSSWTDTVTYTEYDYFAQQWTEVYKNTGQC